MGEGVRAVPSKRLMCHLLHTLGLNGWHLAVSTDLCVHHLPNFAAFLG